MAALRGIRGQRAVAAIVVACVMSAVRGVSGHRAAAAIAVTCLLLAGPQASVRAAPATLNATVPATPTATVPATPTATVPATPTATVPATPTAAAPATPTATALATPTADRESSLTPIVEQPRPFGYVLGDTLTQSVLLGQGGTEFQPDALPPLERASLWFARRSSKIRRAADDRRWLVMEYQLVNAPQTLMTVNLPTVTLKSKSGTVLAVPEWSISVAPLTPRAAFAKGGLQELRPDHPAPLLPTSALQRQLEIWLTVFAVIVAAWFGWWLIRSVRAAANQPFARALREVREAGEGSADSWLALHRAFDRTAGRALQTSTLPVLFKQAPHFATQRAAIEQFYNQSNLRFFGVTQSGTPTCSVVAATGAVRPEPRADGPPPTPEGTVALRTLATTLRRIEKQHER